MLIRTRSKGLVEQGDDPDAKDLRSSDARDLYGSEARATVGSDVSGGVLSDSSCNSIEGSQWKPKSVLADPADTYRDGM